MERGIRARRLAAHRRLIAAISALDGLFLFAGSAGSFNSGVGTSAAVAERDGGGGWVEVLVEA